MNKKTVIILVSTIAAVLVLALVGVFFLSKYTGKNAGKKDDVSSRIVSGQSDTVNGEKNAEDQSGSEETGSEAQTGNESQTENDTKTDSKAQSGESQTSGSDKGASSGQTIDAKGAAITVKDISAKKGQNIKVPVVITKNPGIMAMLLQFDYDADSLEYLGFSKTALFADYQENPSTGNVKILMLSDQDVKEDGEILYLNFKVKQNAKSSSQIKVTAEKDSIGSYNEKLVTLKTVNGTVTVK